MSIIISILIIVINSSNIQRILVVSKIMVSLSTLTSTSCTIRQAPKENIDHKEQKKIKSDYQDITSIKNTSDTDSDSTCSTCSITSTSSTVVTSSSSSSLSKSNHYSKNNTYFEYFFSSSGSESFRHTLTSNNIHDSDQQHTIFCEPFFVCSKLEKTNNNNKGKGNDNAAVTICEGLICIMNYNLALSHHLKAVELDSQQFKNENLQKALSLYTISNDKISNSSNMTATNELILPIDSASHIIYEMAFICNMQHLHLVLGETNNNKRMSCTQFLLNSLTDHYKSTLI